MPRSISADRRPAAALALWKRLGAEGIDDAAWALRQTIVDHRDWRDTQVSEYHLAELPPARTIEQHAMASPAGPELDTQG